MPPSSRAPKPAFSSALGTSHDLSKPAAKPTGFLNVIPLMFCEREGCSYVNNLFTKGSKKAFF